MLGGRFLCLKLQIQFFKKFQPTEEGFGRKIFPNPFGLISPVREIYPQIYPAAFSLSLTAVAQ
jgi:hypothetical protein